MSAIDIGALCLFAVCWLAYQPLLGFMVRGGGLINSDMTVIRISWMRNMAGRENRFMDSQIMGHALSSASFFASSNLLLIAGAAGVLFGGEQAFRSASSLALVETRSRLLFEGQMALVLLTLARGLLDFIWAIRQMNYCLAALGAAPDVADDDTRRAYGEAVGRLLNPALSSFSSGVRGYYFALAAAAWLFGAPTFIAATLGAVTLLIWRQRRSRAAKAVAALRTILEQTTPRIPTE
jgi:uncharacterized membrane protein